MRQATRPGGNTRSTKWTLVRHSAWTPDSTAWAKAVEEASVNTLAEETKILGAGGLLFSTYAEAAQAEYQTNYPPEAMGIYPKARGHFARTITIGGRALYLPETTPAARLQEQDR